MRQRASIFFVGLLLLINVVQAQSAPVVGLVIDPRLHPPPILNEPETYFSRLVDLVTAQGATIRAVELEGPVPSDIDLLIIAAPARRLTLDQLVYLWIYLLDGNNLMLALDPNGYNRVNTELSRGGLNALFGGDYGLGIHDGMLVAPWFRVETIQTLVNTWLTVPAEDIVAHPISAPLAAHDIPVRVWAHVH